ncbi:MAG: hypothetical protein CL840_11845 [Crocinitomicaceae bacterium]|nr:hypothetical protein [Crocinitomicaceae bacterium]|tara:strand:+ start:8430 stop:10781 length:2352 start_codon:yes stop_codon:yes gene_type:complete
MKLSIHLIIVLTLGIAGRIIGQDLPLEFNYSVDSHRLIVGNTVTTGFYDETQIDTIYLQFSQTNYWNQLDQNYEDKIELPATLTHNGVTYDSVGVRFKGQTSYKRLGNKDKKSFAITLDAFIDNQDVEGYEGLNLNNAFEDESHMREVLYLNAIRKHIYAAKGNFIHLYINGQDWGIYPNIQNLNAEHVDEWFLDRDATRWRCERTTTGRPGPGGNFNTGFSTLNYLGDNSTDYTPHYTLKNAEKQDPWQDLIVACSLIEKTNSSAMVDLLNDHFDLDQALWFLAAEIIYTDDDSYVYKGGMDYYVYFDVATDRLVPIEYDGNSGMALNKAKTWTPFYNETDNRFPLLYVLMKVPEIRQRYLAHFRTMMETSFDTTAMMSRIDYYSNLIAQRYANDPKKLYTVQEFNTEIANLKQFVRDRDSFLRSNSEFKEQGVGISSVSHFVNGKQWGSPENTDSVLVLATAASTTLLKSMNLYYGTGLAGRFKSTAMYDDGMHGDGAAGDGQFGGYIPAQTGGQYIRYYIESVANNSANSRAYEPVGAEHDVYIYRVNSGVKVASDVVINELMSSNKLGYADPSGEYDDWVELYNNGSTTMDLTGYYLTDNNAEFLQWEFPKGTTIDPGGYLIVWCDGDEGQSGLHANFKLSANGEQVLLINSDGNIADEVTFDYYFSNYGFARVPNGTGNFQWQLMTPLANNETSSVDDLMAAAASISVYPNPANSSFTLRRSEGTGAEHVAILNIQGVVVFELEMNDYSADVDVSDWNSGVYIIKTQDGNTKRLVVKP